MGHEKERLALWMERRRGPRNPIDEAALLKAAEAFDRAKETGLLTTADLRLIVDAASHPRAMQWSGASGLLGRLVNDFEQAAISLIGMSRHKKSHVRYAAISALRKSTTPAMIEVVLRPLLRDKSAKLRGAAAVKIDNLNYRALLPDLAAACEVEINSLTKAFMNDLLELYREGYYVRVSLNGEKSITVKCNHGTPTRSLKPGEMES